MSYHHIVRKYPFYFYFILYFEILFLKTNIYLIDDSLILFITIIVIIVITSDDKDAM